ncbi:MAG: 3-hydroxyacyl-CoA dehydrogenase [Burkholderiaceae bacterium]|jgi:3-hydroxybutyryl-CoA dehydrogenase
MSVEMNQIRRVGLVGAGTMGRGIAQVCAQAGFEVKLFDAVPQVAEQSKASIDKALVKLIEKGKLAEEDHQVILGRIHPCQALNDLFNCDLVIEAAIENLEIKRQLFKSLDEGCPEQTILVSNTSAIPISSIAALTADRKRIAGLHFMNPVPLMKLVEVIQTPVNSASVVETLLGFSQAIGKTPILVKDGPGFLVGNCARAFYTEALRLLKECIASPAVIDRIIREAGGYRMGPFEVIDLVGLDVNYPSSKALFEDSFFDPRYQLTSSYKLLVEAGFLGRKTGMGFYRYQDGQPLAEATAAAEHSTPAGLPKSAWLWAEKSAGLEMLTTLAKKAGVVVLKEPSPGALCLVAPIGRDTVSVVKQLGIDAGSTVAVDTVYGWASHRTYMACPGVRPEPLAQASTLLSSDGVVASQIHDSPGFIMQRFQAVITNLACDLMQQGLASPEALNQGMKLGFNFPQGPLEAGDALGSETVLTIVQALYNFYEEDRYRPSPWLKRRGRLGLSLSTPD